MNPSSAAASLAPSEFEGHAQKRSIGDLLLRAAHRHPRSGVYMAAAEHGDKAVLLPYPALLDEALRILGGLRGLGRAPGANVALLLERPRDFIPAFWACVLGGYIPCPMVPIHNDRERWAKHLAHVHALLQQPLLITTGVAKEELPDGVTAVDLDALRKGPAAKPFDGAQLNDPAVFVLTSGSTGNSKAVVLTHGNILASMAGKMQRHKLTAADVTLNWISFDHIAALSEAHLLPLYAGATQLHADPMAILSDPLLFLRLIDRYRVAMTFTPNFLLGQINAALQSAERQAIPPSFDLSCLRHIVCGGEAIVVQTARQFLALLEPYGLSRGALWPAFGMTETCAGCVYSWEFPDQDYSLEFASLGLPISGLQMRIVDSDGALVPAGEAGELQLHGPIVFGRYYNNEEATRAAFTADGWFRTGDLGRIEDDHLSLVGRSKDSIIVSGANYFSHELETALQQLDGMELSFVTAFPTRPKGADTEQLVIAFAASFPLDDEARLHQLIVAIRNATILLWGFRPAAILPLPKEAFPKTSLGKIQRAVLRKRFEAGEFAAEQAHVAGLTDRQLGGYKPPEGRTETALAGIYAALFGLDPQALSVTASFFDLGGTSLDIVRVKRAIEQHFGIADLPITTILQNPTVRELAVRIDGESRGQKSEYDPIVPLQITGKKTPLFCIHPAIGEVLIFVNLAKSFVNDRPFYALRTRGFNAGEAYFSSFDAMVAAYAQGIRKQQPHGPYALAGYSYGAPVAFEIAKLFESQGERVDFLGSIDMPPSHEHETDMVECAVNLAFFLSLIDMKQAQELPTRLRRASPRQDPCEYLVRIAPPERLAELDVDLAKFKDWAALAHSLLTIAQPYTPSGSVESVTVFYAHPLRGTKQDWLNNELKRWHEFSRTPVRYVEVPGDHHTLMGPKHVGSFQASLRAEIDRAMHGK